MTARTDTAGSEAAARAYIARAIGAAVAFQMACSFGLSGFLGSGAERRGFTVAVELIAFAFAVLCWAAARAARRVPDVPPFQRALAAQMVLALGVGGATLALSSGLDAFAWGRLIGAVMLVLWAAVALIRRPRTTSAESA